MVRLIALVLFVAACGSVSPQQHDAGGRDGGEIDGASAPPDAAPDAPPLREARELVSGGTRMTGATYTFEVQLGHGTPQNKIAGPTYKLEGNAAVKP